MSANLDTIINSRPPIRCPACGHYCDSQAVVCPACQGALTGAEPLRTNILKRPPVLLPSDNQGSTVFNAIAALIIQVLPAGDCITHHILKPVVLGRGQSSTPEYEIMDLSDFHAYAQGVSRLHCLLARVGDQLSAMDLGSANGTYLNDILLQPNERYLIATGDKMILGKLHLTLFFS
ncbi:MAG TPA: FHA domain-containing protein [Aggregatilineaceae bacterium]|nr:FHA domain-containing protein [Aggregatilineaceae bacterium]